MVRKMTKYSFIVYKNDEDAFFDKLKELGVMDITRAPRAFDAKSNAMFDDSRRYKDAERTLKAVAKKNEGAEIPTFECPSDALLKTVESLTNEQENLNARRSATMAAIKDAAPWGDFNADDIERLNDMGVDLHSYIMKDSDYAKLGIASKYASQVLNNVNGRNYIIVAARHGEPYSFPIAETAMPARTPHELEMELATIEGEQKELSRQMLALSARVDELEAQRVELMKGFDLYAAIEGSKKAAEGALTVYEGFAPTDEDKTVQAALDAMDCYYEHRPATGDDNPPVKLKNNAFARLFEPIANMYMLPKYDEPDLTPYFAPFYMLFFGLCLGDMGYGLLLIIAGTIAALKVPKFKDIGKLVILLGLGSVIMPALNGTFFGGKLYEMIPIFSGMKSHMLTDIQLFWFAILFGVVQILFGRAINAINAMIHHGWREGMANIGWILLIIWCVVAYAGSESGHSMRTPAFDWICGWGGLALIVLFSKTTGNIFLRLAIGVKSLYDITGVFGDMLSYIRLFGLCTSGGILGLVIDSMAMQMKAIPGVGWGLAIIMLIIGHTLVLGLCCLGAFVHPMRLTFVEFYKNAGFTGGGKPYRPLVK
jgi:V/A-type H+-transporting ATPase subunit I